MPPPRILLAEDEPAHQYLIRAALKGERADAQIDVVGTGSELLDRVRGRDFGCVRPARWDILRVADAMDAMTSPRPYRTVMTPDGVIRELRAGIGRQFHPQAARCAIRYCVRHAARGCSKPSSAAQEETIR